MEKNTKQEQQNAAVLFYTVDEAAQIAHCHTNTIRARIKDGTLAATKPARAWLVKADSLAAWLGVALH